MNIDLADICQLADRDLFYKAQQLAAGKACVTCSPNIITGACTTSPRCRHCKWENFKKSGFLREQMCSQAVFLERGKRLETFGITRIFIASGWMGLDLPPIYYEYVQALRQTVNCEIWGLMGALSRDSLHRLRESGMDGYLCGIESPDEAIYRSFRPGGDSLADRLRTLKYAREANLRLWSGFLVGLGESSRHIEDGIRMLVDFDLDSVSILPFLPSPETAMERCDPANPWHWARTMAKACLAMPKAHFFSDQSTGFLNAYGKMGGANAFYVFPK